MERRRLASIENTPSRQSTGAPFSPALPSLEWRKSHASAARGLRTIAAAWALAGVALLLLFAIGVPRWKAHQAAIEAQQRQQEQKQDLARDNALLEAVDQDVSQEVPVAMQPLSWNTASSTSASSTGGLASRQ